MALEYEANPHLSSNVKSFSYAQIQVKATTDWGVISAAACGHKPLQSISQVISEEESDICLAR